MKLIQLHLLFVHQSFYAKMFFISFNYIRQGSRKIQRKHFATLSENLWVGGNSLRCCSLWRELEETWGLRLMLFLLLFHQLHLPLLAFKASGMLLPPSPGWRVVTLRPGKWLPTHIGIAPSEEEIPNPKSRWCWKFFQIIISKCDC